MTGHFFQYSGHCSGSDDHGNTGKLIDTLHFFIVMNLDPQICHLLPIPGQQIPQFSLVAFRTGCNKGSAQVICLLVNHRLMFPQLQYSGSFHAADTATDNMYFLRAGGRYDLVLLPLHGLCVHRTPSQVQGIRQCLIVGNSFIMTHIEAAVVAQNAGADIIFLIVHQLRHPFLVRQELSGESGTVDLTVCNGSRSCLRIHTSGAYHRDIHEFTDMRHILQIAVLRHIDRGMSPVPGIVSTVIAV